MASGIFDGIQFVLDSSSFTYVPFKKKQELRKRITDHGGIISYILTKKSNFVLTADGEKTLSSYKGSTAIKYGVPVVHMDFVADCVLAGCFLDPAPHVAGESVQEKEFSSGKILVGGKQNQFSGEKQGRKIIKADLNTLSMWTYKDPNGPQFLEKDYKIAKDMIFKKTDANGEVTQFFAIELHVIPSTVPCESPRYRVFTHHGSLNKLKRNDKDGQIFKECYYTYTAKEAMGIYVAVHDKITSPPYGYERAWSRLSYKIGSDKMKEQCIEIQESSDGVPPILEVTSLVDYLWKEAVGCLSDTLSVPVERLKLQTVQEAEAVLVSMKECIDRSNHDGQEITKLWEEFCLLIPHDDEDVVFEKSLIAEKQNLCQLIRDIVTVSESTNMSTVSSQIAKYRALRCHIEHLEEGEEEFEKIKESVISSLTERSRDFRVLNIFSLDRPVEESNFTHHLDNQKLLYHASRVSNFVGILSRGLLLPKIVVDDLGGKRSDPGMLGSGIYFGSSASTSAKYSARGSIGSRFMLINEVALGKTKRYRHFDKGLTSAPEGYNSTHGVAESSQETSDFKDDEFVIYNANQQRMRYLVEFSLDGEYVRKRHVDFGVLSNLDPERELSALTHPDEDVDLSDVTSVVDPLSKVQAGLKGSGDQPVPLQAVHIKAKLLDLVAQVVVLQSYKNTSTVPIEAKYVFPLDDTAAVCGFEAFINGKHVIGEVKEKEQARKEYREAISQGHGAYLMDEETPDVFTVSVGNLPPNASVLIKITYVAELAVDGENITFSLPGSVAPWKRSQALDDVTQTDFDTVRIEEETNTTVQVAIEMPFDIRSIQCPTHPIRIKRTATKAVVELEPGHVMGDGFQLVVGLAEIHVPRMWVESHETKHDSEAGMLVFYPEFETEEPEEVEILFCLDASCSMKGSNLKEAKKILQMCVHFLPDNWLFNIIVFGSYHSELFTHSQQKSGRTVSSALDFIKSIAAHKGGTELWRTLESVSLIPSMSAADHPRNVLIISDGHVTEESTTLALVRQGRLDTRVFTLGVGATSNRHMLRALAQVGAGASEFFNSKTKSKWERKVKAQLYKAGQPGLTSVSVTWQQHDSYAKPPIQAPHEIVSLFSGSRLVVYGLVSNCTQAFLTAEVNGREITTMVSTSDLSITRGKILHQLVARGLIKDWEEGNLDKDHTKHEVVKRETKDYIISISKEFSIVSQFTSFIAVEKREKDERFDESLGPSIQELVADEDVDIIPYVSWDEDPSKRKEQKEAVQTTDDKVLHLLNKAKGIENISVLQAEELYKKACDLVVENPQDCTRLVRARAFLELSNFYSSICHDDQKRSAVMDMLKILASEEDEESDDEEVIEQLTDIFGMETLRHYDDEDSDLPFHPNKNLILEIFPESKYGWSKSALEDYDSSTTQSTESTESTESSSSESDSSSADDDEPHVVHRLNIASSSDVSSADDDDHVARILNAFNKKLKSGRRRIEDEEKEEEMEEQLDEDDLDDNWSDDLYDEICEETKHKKHTSLGITRGGKRNTLEVMDKIGVDTLRSISDDTESYDDEYECMGTVCDIPLSSKAADADLYDDVYECIDTMGDIPLSSKAADADLYDDVYECIDTKGDIPLRSKAADAELYHDMAYECIDESTLEGADAKPNMDDSYDIPAESDSELLYDDRSLGDGEFYSSLNFEKELHCRRANAVPEENQMYKSMGPVEAEVDFLADLKAVPQEEAINTQGKIRSSGDEDKYEKIDATGVGSDGNRLKSFNLNEAQQEMVVGFGSVLGHVQPSKNEIGGGVFGEGGFSFGRQKKAKQDRFLSSEEAPGGGLLLEGGVSVSADRVSSASPPRPPKLFSSSFGAGKPEEPSGGTIFGRGSAFGAGKPEDPSGGGIFRRSSAFGAAKPEEPSGGAIFGRGSAFGEGKPDEPSDGGIFGRSNAFGAGKPEDPSGGAIFGKGSAFGAGKQEEPSGGGIFGRSSAFGAEKQEEPSGGGIFGKSNAFGAGKPEEPSSGGIFGKSSAFGAGKPEEPSGGGIFGRSNAFAAGKQFSSFSSNFSSLFGLKYAEQPPTSQPPSRLFTGAPPPRDMRTAPAPPPSPPPGMGGASPPLGLAMEAAASPTPPPPPPPPPGMKGPPPTLRAKEAAPLPPPRPPKAKKDAPPPLTTKAAPAPPPPPLPPKMEGSTSLPPRSSMKAASISALAPPPPPPPEMPRAPSLQGVLAGAPSIARSSRASSLAKMRCGSRLLTPNLRSSKSARPDTFLGFPALKSAICQPVLSRGRPTTGLDNAPIPSDGVSPTSSPPYSPTSPDIGELERDIQEKLPQKEKFEERRRLRGALVKALKKTAERKIEESKKSEDSLKKPSPPRITPRIEEFFKLQNPEGYWSMDDEVFSSIGLDTRKCIAILKDAGAMSLGVEVFNQIARFFATVLMLFLLRSHFPSLFPFSLGPLHKRETEVKEQKWQEQISRAFCWLKAFDKKIPSLCWRLELGNDWELVANLLNDECR